MLFHLGIFLILWLTAGFITGIKFIFIDQMFIKKDIDEFKQKESIEEDDEGFNLITKNKYTFLAFSTLAGFLVLFADIWGTVLHWNKK